MPLAERFTDKNSPLLVLLDIENETTRDLIISASEHVRFMFIKTRR